MADRTVHAVTPSGNEVVRYDRAGKWFLEGEEVGRERIQLDDAVRLAAQPGAEFFYNRPGGGSLDRKVQEVRDREPSVADVLDDWPEWSRLEMALSNAVHQHNCIESWEETLSALGNIETAVESMQDQVRRELRAMEEAEDELEATR